MTSEQVTIIAEEPLTSANIQRWLSRTYVHCISSNFAPTEIRACPEIYRAYCESLVNGDLSVDPVSYMQAPFNEADIQGVEFYGGARFGRLLPA